MKVKTFEGKSEQEVLEKIKKEMGVDAVILNIKKINTKGLLGIMKGSRVEITAAIDNDAKAKTLDSEKTIGKDEIDNFLKDLQSSAKITKSVDAKNDEIIEINEVDTSNSKIDYTVLTLERELKLKEKLIEKQEIEINKLNEKLSKSDELINNLTQNLVNLNNSKETNLSEYKNEYVQIMYDTLIEQNVLDSVARYILEDVKDLDTNEKDLNGVVKIVYNKIIAILGTPYKIDMSYSRDNESRVLLFMGPTGVGKTTTIAKLASKFILENSMQVGLITSDTYRMGAADQLRMYAEILDTELYVAYNVSDLLQSYNKMNGKKDVIFVDTAGRSHKNEQNVDELIDLVNTLPGSEKFLVISLTTKSEDIINIIKTYNKAIDFKVIFSKSDETNALGAIINTCYLTGKQISYITNGQIVPNDISICEPETIAKSILGLGANIV